MHAQSHLTLCDPMDCSPPGSSVHGIIHQEYWSGLPFPPPSDLHHPRIKPLSPVPPAFQANSLSLSRGGSPKFIAALFTVPKAWKEPRCSLMDEWIKKGIDEWTKTGMDECIKKRYG